MFMFFKAKIRVAVMKKRGPYILVRMVNNYNGLLCIHFVQPFLFKMYL